MPDEQEPPIREFADRGTVWLMTLPENLRALLKLARPDLSERIDFDRAERDNRSFIPDDLQKQEADVVYRVPFRRGRGFVWIYLLLEHQSRPDRWMAFRLLSYMVALWQAQVRDFEAGKGSKARLRLSPIVPIVLYTGRRKWSSELSLQSIMNAPGELDAFIPTWETLFIDLKQTPPEDLLQAGEAALLALRALQAVDAPIEELAVALREVASRLDALPEDAQAQIKKAFVYLYLLIRHKRDAEEQDDLFAVLNDAIERHAEEREEAKVTGAEVLLRQGRAEGREEGRNEGREEGREEGARRLLLDQLTAKFGSLTQSVAERVLALTASEFERIAREILTAESLESLRL